jgi:Phosphodiester glycosidase
VRRVWSQTPYYAPFPRGAVLLIGRGRAADWLSSQMSPGVPVNINLTTVPDWRLASTVIGGGPWLLQGGRVFQDPYPPARNEWNRRYPVTAVGVSRNGRQLLFVEIDGRQPHLSIGLTRPQLAAYMQWLGVAQAMAFDSGGSATMVVRFPSRPFPSVVNSPSDGHERPVADAVLVFHTAPSVVRGTRFAGTKHFTGVGQRSRPLQRCCAKEGIFNVTQQYPLLGGRQ